MALYSIDLTSFDALDTLHIQSVIPMLSSLEWCRENIWIDRFDKKLYGTNKAKVAKFFKFVKAYCEQLATEWENSKGNEHLAQYIRDDMKIMFAATVQKES